MSPINQTGKPHIIVPPAPPPPGRSYNLPITQITSRVSQFGTPMGADRVTRPKDPIESKRHEDLRVDLDALQQAIELVNAYGAPAFPSYVLKAGQFDGTVSGWKYKKIEHNLGFTPDRWILSDANSPGWGDIFALKGTFGGTTFSWSDVAVYMAWPDGGTFDTAGGHVRLTFFRGSS